MNYGNHFTKKQCKKTAYKTKRFLYKQRFIGTLSRMSFFTDFFINTIVFIYIFLLLYEILAILFLKFKVKEKLMVKTQQLLIHAWSTVEK